MLKGFWDSYYCYIPKLGSGCNLDLGLSKRGNNYIYLMIMRNMEDVLEETMGSQQGEHEITSPGYMRQSWHMSNTRLTWGKHF